MKKISVTVMFLAFGITACVSPHPQSEETQSGETSSDYCTYDDGVWECSDPGPGGGGGGGSTPNPICGKTCTQDSDCSSWSFDTCKTCVKAHSGDAEGSCSDGFALSSPQ